MLQLGRQMQSGTKRMDTFRFLFSPEYLKHRGTCSPPNINSRHVCSESLPSCHHLRKVVNSCWRADTLRHLWSPTSRKHQWQEVYHRLYQWFLQTRNDKNHTPQEQCIWYTIATGGGIQKIHFERRHSPEDGPRWRIPIKGVSSLACKSRDRSTTNRM